MKNENSQLKKNNSQFRQHLRILSQLSKQKQRNMPKQAEQDQLYYYYKDSKYCFVSSKSIFFDSIQNVQKNSSIRNSISKKIILIPPLTLFPEVKSCPKKSKI
jgi:hypothetical protein